MNKQELKEALAKIQLNGLSPVEDWMSSHTLQVELIDVYRAELNANRKLIEDAGIDILRRCQKVAERNKMFVLAQDIKQVIDRLRQAIEPEGEKV